MSQRGVAATNKKPRSPIRPTEGNRGQFIITPDGQLPEITIGEAKLPAGSPHLDAELPVQSPNSPGAELGVTAGDGRNPVLPDIQVGRKNVVGIHGQVRR